MLLQYLVPFIILESCRISKRWQVLDFEDIVESFHYLWVPWTFGMFCCCHLFRCFKHLTSNSLMCHGLNLVERDFIIIFEGRIWPIETKNITLSCNTWESEEQLSVLKNFTNECHNRECTLWLWEDFVEGWVLSKMCGKHTRMWSKVDHRNKV